jgi:hypothetical protein
MQLLSHVNETTGDAQEIRGEERGGRNDGRRIRGYKRKEKKKKHNEALLVPFSRPAALQRQVDA